MDADRPTQTVKVQLPTELIVIIIKHFMRNAYDTQVDCLATQAAKAGTRTNMVFKNAEDVTRQTVATLRTRWTVQDIAIMAMWHDDDRALSNAKRSYGREALQVGSVSVGIRRAVFETIVAQQKATAEEVWQLLTPYAQKLGDDLDVGASLSVETHMLTWELKDRVKVAHVMDQDLEQVVDALSVKRVIDCDW